MKQKVPLADELVGDEVSKNGMCKWHKRKAFINLYKHDVAFEYVSVLFGDPPPAGCQVVKDIPDHKSFGENDRVYGVIPPGFFMLIKVKKDGDLTRLISAKEISKREFRKNINQRCSLSPDRLWKIFSSSLGSQGFVLDVPEEERFIKCFLSMRNDFWGGSLSPGLVTLVLSHGFDFSEGNVNLIMNDWKFKKRRVDFMSEQMSKI